ncbi:hypothetical protein D3C84_708910 [compost metagenome]
MLVLLAVQRFEALALAFGMLVGQGLAQGLDQFLIVPGLAEVAIELPLVDGLGHHVHIGITGEQDAQGRWVQLADLGQQRGAIHVRHPRIGHHQVDRPLLEDFQGLGATVGQQDLVRLAA